jgi:hypothetical protein
VNRPEPEDDRIPGDHLTRKERAALINENLAKPQVHHPSCVCGCQKRKEGPVTGRRAMPGGTEPIGPR